MYDDKYLSEIERRKVEWEKNTLNKLLEKTPERKKEFVTTSSVPIKRIYLPIDMKEFKQRKEYGYFLDVAPESFDLPGVVKVMGSAKTIFVNAVMGLTPHFFEGSEKLDRTIDSNRDAQKFYGGGDTLQEFKNLSPGLYLAARDMARFGYLYMENGYLNQQIVPSEWVEFSVQNYRDYTEPWEEMEDVGYGFQWWTGRFDEYPIYFASGFGGQWILNVPDLNMIIVATMNAFTENNWQQMASLIPIIYNNILPAVIE